MIRAPWSGDQIAAVDQCDDGFPSIRSELRILKWLLGFVLALQIVLFFKVFLG